MPAQRKKIVVVGAGIVGLSCALHAQRRGHDVTVIDPRGFGNGASSGNAGVVAVSECMPLATPGTLKRVPRMLLASDSPLSIRWSYAARIAPWLLRFVRSGTPARVAHAMESLASILALAKAAHRDLAALAGSASMIQNTGWLKAYETDRAYEAARGDFERMRVHGVDCRYLERAAVQAHQPNLADIFRHAIFHPECDQIGDPQAYTASFGAAFLRAGGTHIRAEAAALERRGGSIVAALTGTDRYEADCFVIAAGAWSKKLCADAGATLPLDTERGYHVVLSGCEQDLPASPVYWDEKSIVMSASGDRLRVTSSVEFAGLAGRPDFRKLKKLLPEIRRAHKRPPGPVVGEWLGFRPSMPDSLPVIGAAPRADNAFLAFGHGHCGLTLGPVTGALVAQLIDGVSPDVDLLPFSPGRFR
jgi:D-amino-acid dehydrogenase